LIIQNRFKRRSAYLNLRADLSNLSGLLFELRREHFHSLLLLGDG
jgi:hypothetical protein